MLRVLVCSTRDLANPLKGTFIGRQGIETFRADKMNDVRLLASTLGPQLILVDGEMPSAASFVQGLRQEPATRHRSVAVLLRGGADEKALLAAGANVALSWPPDGTFDGRLSRLMTVPARLEARLTVDLAVSTQPDCAATVVNLSLGGMLLQSRTRLSVGDEMGFRLPLPDGEVVSGRARVAREARPGAYGVEFTDLPDDGRAAIGQFLRSIRMD